MSQGPFLRKYGVAATIDFDLFEVDGVDFRVDAVHAVGDTKVMKDEGAEANTSNAFTDEGQGYSIVLTATEMQAAQVKVYIVDLTATKVWLDTSIVIETYGNASAMHAFDLDSANVTVGALVANAITAAAIASNAITAPKIAANAITAAKIADGAIDAATFAANAIDAAAIATDAITAASIAADAVTEMRSLVNGTSDAGGSSTTMVDAARTEVADVLNGNWILFTSGAVANQCRLITDFDAVTDTITFAPAATAAIGAGIAYEILPNGAVDVQSWLGTVTGLASVNALVSGRVDVSAGAMAANVLTAAAIAAAALDGKGDWNVGKTGYSLTQTFPTNFADMAITVTTGRVDIATNNDKTGYALTVAEKNDIVDRTLDEDMTAHQTLGTLGQAIGDPVADTGTIYGKVTTILGDTDDMQTRLPASLVAGRIDASVGAMAADTLTAAALATDAVDEIRNSILPEQNVALPNIEFLFVAASDHVTPVTAATGTAVTRSIDGGAFGAGTGTLAEVGNGIYQYDASAADMNGGIITFRFIATGGTPGAPDDAFLTIVTGAGV